MKWSRRCAGELLLLGGLAENAAGAQGRHREGARQRRGGGVVPAHGRRIGRPGRLRRPPPASSAAGAGGGAGGSGEGCLGHLRRDPGGGSGGARARGRAHTGRSINRPHCRIQRGRRARRRGRRRAAAGAGPRAHGRAMRPKPRPRCDPPSSWRTRRRRFRGPRFSRVVSGAPRNESPRAPGRGRCRRPMVDMRGGDQPVAWSRRPCARRSRPRATGR